MISAMVSFRPYLAVLVVAALTLGIGGDRRWSELIAGDAPLR